MFFEFDMENLKKYINGFKQVYRVVNGMSCDIRLL